MHGVMEKEAVCKSKGGKRIKCESRRLEDKLCAKGKQNGCRKGCWKEMLCAKEKLTKRMCLKQDKETEAAGKSHVSDEKAAL